MLARLEDAILVVVDVQPKFFDTVWRRDEVLERIKLMVSCAGLLDVPVIVTEQVPDKMGATEQSLAELLDKSDRPVAKSAFSCWGEEAFVKLFDRFKRPQVVLVGIETHICVCQTAHDLLDEDLDVIVCADAVSARTEAAHMNGLKRMSDEGTAVAHTESVVYEWMRDAGHPAFRDVLKLIKGEA